jgi:hypothetical protein
MCHAVLVLVTAAPTALIPFGPLHAKLGASASGGGGGGAGGGSSSGSSQAVVEWDGPTLRGRSHTEVELLRAGKSPGCSNTQPEAAGQDWGAWLPDEQRRGSGDKNWGGTRSRGAGGGDAAADMLRPLLRGPPSEGHTEKHHSWQETGSRAGGFGGKGGVQGGRAAHQQGTSQGFHHHQHQHEHRHTSPEAGRGLCWEGQAGQPSVHYWDGMRRLLLNPHALVFYGMVLVMGFGAGTIEGYLFLYLDSLGEHTAAAPHIVSFVFLLPPFLQLPRSIWRLWKIHMQVRCMDSWMLCALPLQASACWKPNPCLKLPGSAASAGHAPSLPCLLHGSEECP